MCVACVGAAARRLRRCERATSAARAGLPSVTLYNASNDYSTEWFDVKGTVAGSIDVSDLGLPLEWDGLQQAQSDVGVKAGPNDARPTLDGPVAALILQPVRFDAVAVDTGTPVALP